MTDFVWPSGRFYCPDPDIQLVGNSQSGGGTIDGAPGQLVDTSGGGYWKIDWSARLTRAQDIMAAEAWRSLINSGAQELILPLRQAKSPALGSAPAITVEANAFPARVTLTPLDYTHSLTGHYVNDVAVGDVDVTIDCTSVLYAGRFSTRVSGRWYMYDLAVKGSVTGDEQDFEIRPPQRKAAVGGVDDVWMSYCFLHVTCDPGSFKITYDRYTRNLATLDVTFYEARTV